MYHSQVPHKRLPAAAAFADPWPGTKLLVAIEQAKDLAQQDSRYLSFQRRDIEEWRIEK